MQPDGLDRLEQKTPQQMLHIELVREFGFPPIVADALVKRVDAYITDLKAPVNPPGKVSYLAVSTREPPGKALNDMALVPVTLTLHHADDIQVLRHGSMNALREVKISRLADEAADQGAYLTQEDLALLVCTSERSVRRAVARLRSNGLEVPTRGQKMDIGKGVSHKTRIVDLWLRGFQYSEIEKSTHHTPGCIQRYLVDFSRVVFLQEKGLPLGDIRQVTGMSERLVREYLDLLAKHDTPTNDRLRDIRRGALGKKRPTRETSRGGPPT